MKQKKPTINEYKKQIAQVANSIAMLEVKRLVLTLDLQKLQKSKK